MYLYLKKNDFLDMLKFSRYYDMSYLHMHEISLCSVLHILEKYVYIVYAQKWVFICRKKETHTHIWTHQCSAERRASKIFRPIKFRASSPGR